MNTLVYVFPFTVCVSVIDETLSGSAGFDNVTLRDVVVVEVNPDGS
ncbi:MAG: hypothetical protein HQK85_11340, partial [Nitrospinae bacterium]|nr:hypothetical protein [Nitrospinota bacterium]